MAKLKIVWICHFSNELVRKQLNEGIGILEAIARKILNKPFKVCDFAQWNTNAIREFEKFTEDVELHVISPGYFMKGNESIFDENGIHYYFFFQISLYLFSHPFSLTFEELPPRTPPWR